MTATATLRVVIHVPAGDERSLRLCMWAIDRAGHALVAVAPTWVGAEQMVAAGEADNIMVADESHIPPRRVLLAADVGIDDAKLPRQRRPRRVH